MRTPSGDLHVVDFKTSQIVSVIQPKDYWDDKRHWEIKNNIDTLEFKVFENTDHAAMLVQQNLVLKEVRDGRIVPYVITEVEKNSDDRSLTVYASGEWIQLAKAGIISPQKFESKTLKECMEIALKGTKWKIGETEHNGSHSMTIDEFTDPLNLLKKIAASFELEIQYRAEVLGSQIVGRYVDMVKKRGRDTKKEVTLGKDLMGIKRIENSQNICTALLGFVRKEGGGFITISEINNGVPYLVDDDAFQRWNEKGQHKFGFYTPETEDQDMSPQRLKILMKTEMDKRVNTSVSYDVQAQSIGRVFGLAHELINEGDTIRIKDTGFTPKLYLEARAVAGNESFKNPDQDDYAFGDYREIVDPNDELRRLYQKMLSSLYDKVPQGLFDQLKDRVNEQNKNIIDAKDKADKAQKESQTAKDLAEATRNYMEQNLVDIIESVKPPTVNLKPNKTLWRDISGGKPGILKIWTGTVWESVVPDVEKAKKETLEQVNKDIESTKTELNKKVQEAQNQATGQVNEVKESLQGVSRTISNIENKQGEIDKKVTKFEQDSSGFKTSIESLTKKDTEISNKLNTVETTVEGTKKTVSDVQQTTNDLKKVTTEIKEEAGKISEKLESVETKIANTKIGGRNVVVGTTIPAVMIGTNINNQAVTIYRFAAGDSRDIMDGKEFMVSFDWEVIGDAPVGKMYMQGSNPYPGFTGAVTFSSTNKKGRYSRVALIPTGTAAFLGVNMRCDGLVGTLKISNFQIEIGNKATEWTPAPEDQVTTDEFTKKTTEIEKSVDGVKTTVTNVQNSQGTMQTTLNQVQQTTNSNSQNITSLTQMQGQQGAIVQQNTSDITQLNNQIKSKVSDTQMQEYVGGLGSTNLLFNTAFESRTIEASTGVITSRTPSVDKWGLWANGTNFKAAPESARNHDGFNSVKLETTDLTANKPSSMYQGVASQANSGDHVFSAWFYTDNKALLDGGAYMEVSYYNGGTWVASKAVQLVPLLVNNSWVFASATLPAPATAHNAVRGNVTINRNGRLWVSQPLLQKGITPSTFMENPKDYANYDQLVGEISKKMATSDFNSKVSTIETSINQQSNRIDFKAEKNDIYNKIDSDGRYGSKAIVESHTSQLSVMSTEINSRVKSGDIASTINQTAQSVLIQAGKIYLDGHIEAKHLKAQTLQGVTIQTAPQGSGANQIRLNAQNMTLYGSNQARGYFGFINRTDSNIQSALILGNDYESSGTLNGSLVLDQTTIAGTQWTNSVASIGIATGRSGNDILKSSYINFYRFDGGMELKSQGDFKILNDNGNVILNANATGSITGFINLSASKDINFTAKRGYFYFHTSDNRSYPSLVITDKSPTNNGDVDFTFANQLMFRVARHPDYVGDGLQIKNGTGTSWANMKLGVLRTMGNIGCDADVYAKNFINTSTRKVKTNIEDLPFSALKKVNSVRIKKYNLISDVEKYNAGEIDVLPVNYGMIAEDTDEVFTTKEKDAVTLYGSVSITMQAVQELDYKADNMQFDIGMLKQELEAEKLEKVFIQDQLYELKDLVVRQEDRIAKLEELLLQQLIDKKPEQS